jgi:hypothetical protein
VAALPPVSVAATGCAAPDPLARGDCPRIEAPRVGQRFTFRVRQAMGLRARGDKGTGAPDVDDVLGDCDKRGTETLSLETPSLLCSSGAAVPRRPGIVGEVRSLAVLSLSLSLPDSLLPSNPAARMALELNLFKWPLT